MIDGIKITGAAGTKLWHSKICYTVREDTSLACV